jgi:hypothetical protein
MSLCPFAPSDIWPKRYENWILRSHPDVESVNLRTNNTNMAAVRSYELWAALEFLNVGLPEIICDNTSSKHLARFFCNDNTACHRFMDGGDRLQMWTIAAKVSSA